MASGILKIFDFLNRGQRLRRGQPSELEMEDHDIKQRLLLRGHERSELSSALSALDKLDSIKKSQLDRRVEMGDLSEDEFVHRESDERDQDRRALIDERTARTKRLTEGPIEPEIDISPEEAGSLPFKIKPGKYSASVFRAMMEGHGDRVREGGLDRRAAMKGGGGVGVGEDEVDSAAKFLMGGGSIFAYHKDKRPAIIERAQQAGYKGPATSAQVTGLLAVPKAEMLAKRMNGLVDKLFTEKGLVARGQGLLQRGAAAGGYDDDTAEYEALKQFLLVPLARAAGETGPLSEPEQARYLQFFPKLGENKTLAKRKMDNIWGMLGVTQESMLEGIGGARERAAAKSLAQQAREELARRRGRQ